MDIADAAREFMEATLALHTTHASTDVHETGAIAGQAITDHCAWECKALDARVDPATMKVEGAGTRRIHENELIRYERAGIVLREELMYDRFKKAWKSLADDDFVSRMGRASLAAAAPEFAKRMVDDEEEQKTPEVPEHLMYEGKVNYLTKNVSGEWWVSTRKDGQPYSGMPLARYLAEDV